MTIIVLRASPLCRHHGAVLRACPGRGKGARIREILLVILPPLLLNDLAIMILVIVVGIFTTHRIAGPVYRIAMDIDRRLSGRAGRARAACAGSDSLADLAEKVNQLIERIDDARKG